MYMRFESQHNKMLKLASIQQINEGLVVMKHFFELNRKLLPLYFNLNIKKEKSVRDYLDIDKINSVNDSYNFDVKASKVLLNSDILDYIQNAFFVIQNEGSDLNEKKAALNIFMSEYNYLKKNWENVDAN